MKSLVILFLSVAVATSYAMKVQKRQLQPANSPPAPVAVASQPVVNNAPITDVVAPAVSNANANLLAEPGASDIVGVNSQPAPVQAAAAPSNAAAALTSDAVVSAPSTAAQNAAQQKSESESLIAHPEGDYFFYDPMEMMYNLQDRAYDPAYYPAYDAAYDPAYDPAFDPQYNPFNEGPGDANNATNHTCSVIQVALLNNVFYFTRASTLIASVESLLQYEEQLFNSASFQKMLSNAPGDYDYISLAPKSNQPTTA